MKKACTCLLIIFIASCSNSKKSAIKNIDANAVETKPADSVLASLQANNELLLVYAIEDFAWTRTTTYRVLANNNKEWKSYFYKAPHNNLFLKKDAAIIVTTDVAKAAGDSVLSYFTQSEAWKIKGDNGKDFCQSTSPDGVVTACNITDQPTSKLMMITRNKIVSSSYYAPEYFDKCCPGNEDRKKFLTAIEKIKVLVVY